MRQNSFSGLEQNPTMTMPANRLPLSGRFAGTGTSKSPYEAIMKAG